MSVSHNIVEPVRTSGYLREAAGHVLGLSPVARDFLLHQFWDRRFKITGLFISSIIFTVLELLGVGLIFPVLIILLSPDYLDKSPALVALVNTLGIGRGFLLSAVLTAIIAVLLIGKNVYMIFFNLLQVRLMAYWKLETSVRLMRMYVFADYVLHLKKTSSEIIRNLALTTAVYDHFVTGFLSVLVNAVLLISLGLLLIVVLPHQAVFAIVGIFLVTVVLYRYMREPFEKIGKDQNDLFEQRQSVLRQLIGMMKETKISAKERYFLDSFSAVEKDSFFKQAHANFLSIIPGLVIEAAVIAAVLGLVAYLVILSPEAGTGIAVLGMLAATMFRMMPLLNRMVSSLQLMNLGRDAVEIFAREFHTHEADSYIPDEEPPPLPFKNEVGLRNVSFLYPTGTIPALSDITMQIKKDETVGITGPSGSGKTTLAALLMALLPPSSGAIEVDGTPLVTPDQLRAWHKHLGYVPQGIYLLQASIAQNISLATNPSEQDDARIWEVLEIVQLKEFVESLPNTIHHYVGEDGTRLSGGQRQRLGIARALYAEPNVLVLDEATSGLDVGIEHAFTENLRRLRRSRTMIIIAHRISTLRHCDRIVMLEGGRITDFAPFEVLEERCPPFKRLVDLSRMQKQPQ
jgi:ATP-binding cassette, subfamily B, bacterial PglK